MRTAETTAAGVIRAVESVAMNTERIAGSGSLPVDSRPESAFLEQAFPEKASPDYQSLDMVICYMP